MKGLITKIKKGFLYLFRSIASSDYRYLRLKRIFDTDYYLSQAGTSAEVTTDPLYHYLKTAKRSKQKVANPHPFFDTEYYTANYSPEGLSVNPFIHFLKTGWKEGKNPGPLFNIEHYLLTGGWSERFGDPLSHYMNKAGDHRVVPSSCFDSEYYIDRTPKLRTVQNALVKHYKMHGSKAGKSPLPIFDPDFYLEQLVPREQKSAIPDPLSHFLTYGDRNDLKPSEWFDPNYYGAQPALENSGIKRSETLAHYIQVGVHQGLYTDERVEALKRKPIISVIVPVYNPNPHFLRNCIRSVLYQTYPFWELCLADDCSSDPETRKILEEWAAKDSRIKLIFLEENQGISGATNSAASLATGEYLGFLDNDDELRTDCLYHVAKKISEEDIDFIYTDERLVGEDNRFLSIFRKPPFNRDLLFSHNYITHFVVTRRELFNQLGGLDPQFDGAQDFDFMLRLTERTNRICHIPKILYHWRTSETSTNVNHSQKTYANLAGKNALTAALARRNLPFHAENTELNFYYKLVPDNQYTDGVLLICWVEELTESFKRSIRLLITETDYHNLELLILTRDASAVAWAQEVNKENTEKSAPLQVKTIDSNISRAQASHEAIAQNRLPYFALIELPITRIAPDWVHQLRGGFRFDRTGISCGRIYRDGTDGLSYVLPDLENKSPGYHLRFLTAHSLHVNGIHCPQELACCTWDMLLCRTTAYTSTGGFDPESFSNLYAMADLSLTFQAHHYLITYNPFAWLDRIEDTGELTTDDALESHTHEKEMFQKKWLQTGADRLFRWTILEDNGYNQDSFSTWLSG